jgi:hypothetical protein
MVTYVSSTASGKARKENRDPHGVVSDTESSDGKVESPRSTRRSRAGCNRHALVSPHHAKHYVEHNYHDHKYDPIEYSIPNLALIDDNGCPKRTGHKGGVSTPFPEKLHEMLESVDQQGTHDVIGWQAHGRCFVVHKPKEFVETVMPK